MLRRTSLVAVALAALVSAAIAGPALAGASKLVITFDNAAVNGTAFAVDLVVNRGAKQISSCTYRIDAGAATACGSKVARNAKTTAYLLRLTSQADGQHTLSVTVGLTDGGVGTASTAFTIDAPRVFARAWTERNGVAGFQAGSTDVMVAQLEDTTRDDAVSTGDTVRTNRYPLDIDGSDFGTFGVTSHIVTEVNYVFHNVSVSNVTLYSGANILSFFESATEQSYDERARSDSSGTFRSAFRDVRGGLCSDFVKAASESPSVPGTAFWYREICRPSDDTFVEIAFDLPV